MTTGTGVLVKLMSVLVFVSVETMNHEIISREYNDIESDTETIHTIKNVEFSPHFDSDIAILELHDSVNTCRESNRECWPIQPLQLPSPGLRIRPGQDVRTLGKT